VRAVDFGERGEILEEKIEAEVERAEKAPAISDEDDCCFSSSRGSWIVTRLGAVVGRADAELLDAESEPCSNEASRRSFCRSDSCSAASSWSFLSSSVFCSSRLARFSLSSLRFFIFGEINSP